jgi:hypothetical protein
MLFTKRTQNISWLRKSRKEFISRWFGISPILSEDCLLGVNDEGPYMEWWLLTRISWAICALTVLCATSIIIWRASGVLSWKRSLKGELKDLKKDAEQATESRREAIGVIERRCEEVLNSFSPTIGQICDISQYVISIAACYHPHTDRPELQITIGHFLRSLEKSLDRFERILRRQGFKRLQSVNIRKINSAHRRFLQLSGSPHFRWYLRHRRKLHQFSKIRFLLFPDPFTWLVFLSQRLTLLMVTKYLLLDLYLFLGRLALEAYDDQSNFIQEEDRAELEKILEELDSLPDREGLPVDPQIVAIRNRLVGLTSMAISTPTIGKWKSAVSEVAGIISRKHFPESDFPMEEAALGPLLERTYSWIAALRKGGQIRPVSHLYRIRLDTLYRAKNLSDTLLPKSIQNLVLKTLKTYGWLKWPLKSYRWSKKGSPWTIALTLGWVAAKKTIAVYVYGKTFDKACKELEHVYSQSRELKKGSILDS